MLGLRTGGYFYKVALFIFYMRSDKRGQFYLLAAVVIVSMIIGFVGVNNLLKRGGGVDLDYTGEELDFESGQVLEYGVTYDGELGELVEHFTTSYEEYAGSEKEILFVFGDSQDTIEVYSYTDAVIGNIGAIGASLSISRRDKTKNFNVDKSIDGEVTVTFKNQEYVFEIKPGDNFYFVISQTVGDEEYIITN